MSFTNSARFVVAFLCMAIMSSPFAAESHVGFREMKNENLVFGVWYPTETTPQVMSLGPFEVNYAKDAPPHGEMLPLVLLSHGVNGRYRNHHLTASDLARNGYIVIAPQHKEILPRFEDMPGRVDDFKNAVVELQNNSDFDGILDADTIHAVGYSRGGAAVLAAAGVDINFSAYKFHCAQNYDKDENACRGFTLWLRTMLRLVAAYGKKQEKEVMSFSDNSLQLQKIALVAPVGIIMDAESLAKMKSETLIMQIKDDEQLRAPYHSEHLRKNLPAHKTQHMLISPGHHYAFVGPFPKQFADKIKDIPGFTDPPNFDRRAFIKDINQKILDFLAK